MLTIDRETQSTNRSWYPKLQFALPREFKSIKQWEMTFFFFFCLFRFTTNQIQDRWRQTWVRGGPLKTPGGASPLLEPANGRTQAIWEYWIAYHCTNQRKEETLIESDMKPHNPSQAPPCVRQADLVPFWLRKCWTSRQTGCFLLTDPSLCDDRKQSNLNLSILLYRFVQRPSIFLWFTDLN